MKLQLQVDSCSNTSQREPYCALVNYLQIKDGTVHVMSSMKYQWTMSVPVKKVRKDSKNTEGGNKKNEDGKLRLKTVLR